MAIEALTSFIYQVVEQSWTFSTVLIKYVLIAHLAELIYRDKKSNLRNLEEIIIKYSRLVVVSIVLLGFTGTVFGLSPEPNFKTLSELAAVIYFGFLFWKF